MARYRWKTDFTDEYKRLRSGIDRDYGEHAYGDKEKIETTGMLRDAEPDYQMHMKPYKPKEDEPTPWEAEPISSETEKVETHEVEPEPMEPLSIEEQREAYKLLDNPESSPIEDGILEADESDVWDPFEALEPGESPDDFISDAEIVKKEKMKQMGIPDSEAGKSNGY